MGRHMDGVCESWRSRSWGLCPASPCALARQAEQDMIGALTPAPTSILHRIVLPCTLDPQHTHTHTHTRARARQRAELAWFTNSLKPQRWAATSSDMIAICRQGGTRRRGVHGCMTTALASKQDTRGDGGRRSKEPDDSKQPEGWLPLSLLAVSHMCRAPGACLPAGASAAHTQA